MDLRVNLLPTCESYLEGKMTKMHFLGKGDSVKEVLELVHSDVYGPMNIQARGGYEYYFTFLNDNSMYGYVYLMHRKNETFEKF